MTTAEKQAGPSEHTVEVQVNNRPVTVMAPKVTGRQIKQAAILAGLPIRIDFVLSHLLPNDRAEIVGDDDEVTVNKTSRFTAVAPDDNS